MKLKMLLPRNYKLSCLQTRDTRSSTAALEWSTDRNHFLDARWTCMTGPGRVDEESVFASSEINQEFVNLS